MPAGKSHNNNNNNKYNKNEDDINIICGWGGEGRSGEVFWTKSK